MSLKITDPRKAGPIIGIDLGTTNSLVAIVRDGKPEVLSSREGGHLVPSVVSFVAGSPVVGLSAKKNKVRDASHTVFSVKRLLGRDFSDLKSMLHELPFRIVPSDGVARIDVDGRTFTAIEISAMILKELKLAAEKELGQPVHQAVVTVPAYFNDSQRQATRAAGRLAGLDVLRIINEPTAASLAYGLDRKKEGLVAVYDLGGGTFDVSILKLKDGIFEVLATNGNTALGGDDLDQAIAQVAGSEIRAQWGIDPFADIQLHASILETAEKLKIALSENPEASFEVNWNGRAFRRVFTAREFESLVEPILEKTRGPCIAALEDAGIQASELSDVVLVGGPTRLEIVRGKAREIFGKDPNTSVHPDEVVAIGAAIQGDILAGNNKDLLLLDVVPLSLGIETYGGVMSTLIHRNTRIPTVAREAFTTFMDNQTAVDIHVLQGERERVEDNRSLARFKLRVEPALAGSARVEVSFLVDADGILQVSAKDLRTGNEQSVEVRPTYGLSNAEVEKILAASAENLETDLQYRQLVAVKNDAEPVLRAAEKKLSDAFRLLPEPEARDIESKIQGLRTALGNCDPNEIQTTMYRLNESTRKLADLILRETLVASSAGGSSKTSSKLSTKSGG